MYTYAILPEGGDIMYDLIEAISNANELEIEKILKAVLARYAVLFPDRELSAISLQKSSDPNEQLDRIISFLQKMKTTHS